MSNALILRRLPLLTRIALLACGVATVGAQAQQVPSQRVEINGERTRPPLTQVTENIEAAPASTTVLDRRDLDKLSISTYGDLLRKVPGFYIGEYQQGLVAYDIGLRGFNTGHGRDVAFTLDGVPLNVTGSQLTNGYSDLAVLIPEIVDRVEIVRGPFSVTSGNHAVGGSINLFTDRNTPSMVKLDLDHFGRVRVLPVVSAGAGPGRLLLALDALKGPGYHDQSDVRRANFFARYSIGLGAGQASVRLQYYDAEAESPFVLDKARVVSGELSPRAALSPGQGDGKEQGNLVFNYRSDDTEGSGGLGTGWQASLYVLDDDRRRFRGSLVSSTQPVGEPMNLRNDRDRLDLYGFDVRKATMLGTAAMPAQLLLGVQYNNEDIEARRVLVDSQRRELGDDQVSVRRDVLTRTGAIYGQYQISPLKGLKLVFGGRYDVIDLQVRLRELDDAFGGAAGNSFGSVKRQFSPKLGVAYALTEGAMPVELFANAARGLKSPYPFGDFARIPTTHISSLDSYELGLRGSTESASWRVSVWRTSLEEAALFNSNDEFLGNQRTRRDGFDLEGQLALSDSLRVLANYSGVRGRLVGQMPNDRTINEPEWTAGLGIEKTLELGANRFELSLHDFISGPQPLVADNSRRTLTFNRVSARMGYANVNLKGAKFVAYATYYDRPYEEVAFDFGDGLTGIIAKARIKTGVSVQYVF